MRIAVTLVVALATCTPITVGGFVSHTQTTTSIRQPTSRFLGNTKQPPILPEITDISYGEESRQYRRTVFSHDDWRRFRSAERFPGNLLSISKSGIYKNLAREVTFGALIAAFIVVFNALVGGFVDLQGVKHAAVFDFLPVLGLPETPFVLASPALSLLLVFRTGTSYQRWDEARKNWGLNINHTRNLVRLANALYDKKTVSPQRRQDDLKVLSLCTWAFVRSMKRHLSPPDQDEDDFQRELFEKLPAQQAQNIIDAAHRPNRALQDLSTSIENLNMHFLRKDEIHAAVTIFEDTLGSSERLLTSPVPLFYTRHTARFLLCWLYLLPFALYDPFAYSWNHIMMIPAMAAISVFLFGIDELATQMEEPFTILPMQGFCDKIYNWCTEIVSFEAGDNGMAVNEPRREHALSFPGADKSR